MDKQRTPYGQILVLFVALGALLTMLIGGRSKQGNLIAFVSNRNGTNEIFVMDSDGSNQRQLTCNHDVYSGPIWSPDGQQIAFVSVRDQGNFEIYLVNISDALQNPPELESCEDNSLRLTWNDELDLRPTWSPDSQKIAFVSYRDNAYKIYVMNWDGSDQRALTENGVSGSSFTWSPSAQQIAYDTSRDGNLEIYVMDFEGNNPRRLTNNDVRDIRPMWSPDGRYILFQVRGDGIERLVLYVMNVDGSNRQRLFLRNVGPYQADNDSTFWSPDSRYIVFDARYQGYSDIYTIEVATGNPLQLTQDRAEDADPAWSSDGKHITFVSNRDRNWEIYLMDADGRNLQRLTWNDANDVSPAWQP